MKTINVVAAIITSPGGKVFATQRGYGEWKDWWEFPGGKIEPGEEPAEALQREIREELATEINVGERLCTVEYDYPKLPAAPPPSLRNDSEQALTTPPAHTAFHLSMQCFLCTIKSGDLTLLEHEDARWLSYDDLDSVRWLAADEEVIERLKRDHFPDSCKKQQPNIPCMPDHKIYVASSWRNAFYPDVVKALREAGHEVYDFRNPPTG